MATGLDITVQGQEQLQAMQRLLDPQNFDRSMKAATKFAANAAKPAIAKQIGARYNIKASRIKDEVGRPFFSNGGAVASVRVSGATPTAFSYGATGDAKRLTMGVFRGARRPVPGAFIQTKSGNQKLPMIATTGSRLYKPRQAKRKNERRKGLNVVRGPSIASILARKSRFGQEIRREVDTRLAERFVEGMKRELGRKKRGF